MTILTDAIATKTCVTFTYSDKPRCVEVHAVGLGKGSKLMMRGYQTNEDGGWKLFEADKMTHLSRSEEESLAPRPGFAAGDKAMNPVMAEVAA